MAGNQGNHQNFDPFLISKNLWLIFMEMKQKHYLFEKNNSKWPVSRIDWCEGHWCGSTYMVERLSNVSSKTGKNAFFVFLGRFWAYWQLAIFESAILNLKKKKKKNLNGRLKKLSFSKYYHILKNSVFLSRPFWFFFQKKYFFCFISKKTSSPFIWGIIFFWTMDDFFRIL